MKKSIQILLIIFLIIVSAKTLKKIQLSNYADELRFKRELLKSDVKVSVLNNNGFVAFREAVGWSESSNRYHIVNRLGYIGKYQFGKLALKDVGIKSKSDFMNSPHLQDKAFKTLCSVNKYRLRKHISKYAGTLVNGILITESGLIAASHLVGATAVKKYLNSKGKLVSKDANNVTIEVYIKKFSNYNLNLKPIRKIC